MMPDVVAVCSTPTCAVPVIVGVPVAGVLTYSSTGSMSSLVSVSLLSRSSVKLTLTLMVLPSSDATGV